MMRLPEGHGLKKEISGGGIYVSEDKELGSCRACSEDRTVNVASAEAKTGAWNQSIQILESQETK